MRRAVLVAAALAAGCNARPLTEVVVVVHTSYAVPTDLDGVRIDATRAGSPTTTSMGAWSDASQPRVLGLVHEGGALGPVDVTVVGLLGPTELVERDASFSFVEGEIRRLDLWLVPECATNLRPCRGSQTCDPGPTCREPQVGLAELAPWTGSIVGVDASVRREDAGVELDAPSPADASSPADARGTDALSEDALGTDAADACCPPGAPGVVATSCVAGECVIDECEPNLAHCDTSIDNGCETRLDSRNDCGMCGRRCRGGTTCTMVGDTYDCR